MLNERKQIIISRVDDLISIANDMHNITLPDIQIRFDLTGRVAGAAGVKTVHGSRIYYMRFNVQMMQNSAWDHLYKDTVPHELAHIVGFAERLCRNHDSNWKRICRALGGSGERCHSEEVVHKGGTFYYTLSSGRVIPVGKIQHSRIQQGTVYTNRTGEKVHAQCSYSTTRPSELSLA
jgi:predicted SprT family Zn-dependent metalloprotease